MLKRKINNKGFTIIEVLIVLAIAALILLIVFLAVPALQRSARNTSRKDDVAAILSGISEFENNNGGALPTSMTPTAPPAPTLTIGGGETSGVTTNTVNVGYYNQGYVGTLAAGTVTISIGPKAVTADGVDIEFDATCNGNTPTSSGASTRSVAAVYEIETGGSSLAQQCTSE